MTLAPAPRSPQAFRIDHREAALDASPAILAAKPMGARSRETQWTLSPNPAIAFILPSGEMADRIERAGLHVQRDSGREMLAPGIASLDVSRFAVLLGFAEAAMVRQYGPSVTLTEAALASALQGDSPRRRLVDLVVSRGLGRKATRNNRGRSFAGGIAE